MASNSQPVRGGLPLVSRRKACPICLTKLKKCELGKPNSCTHYFCLSCIQEWAKNVNTCPIDRKPFSEIEVYSNLTDHTLTRKIHVPTRRFEDVLVDPDDITFCEVCRQSNNENILLLCDGCDKGYHTYCLNPPMASIPDGTWYCEKCRCLVAAMNLQMMQEVSSDSELSSIEIDPVTVSDTEEEDLQVAIRGRKSCFRVESDDDDEDLKTFKYHPRNLSFDPRHMTPVERGTEGARRLEEGRPEPALVQNDVTTLRANGISRPTVTPLTSPTQIKESPSPRTPNDNKTPTTEANLRLSRKKSFNTGSYKILTLSARDLKTQVIKIHSRTPSPSTEGPDGEEEEEEDMEDEEKWRQRVLMAGKSYIKLKSGFLINRKCVESLMPYRNRPEDDPNLKVKNTMYMPPTVPSSHATPSIYLSSPSSASSGAYSKGAAPGSKRKLDACDTKKEQAQRSAKKFSKMKKSAAVSPRARTVASHTTIRQAFRDAVIASHRHDQSELGFQEVQKTLAKSRRGGGLPVSPFSSLKHNVALPAKSIKSPPVVKPPGLEVTSQAKRNLTIALKDSKRKEFSTSPQSKRRRQLDPELPSCSSKTDYVGPIESSLDLLDANQATIKRDGSIHPLPNCNANNNRRTKRKSVCSISSATPSKSLKEIKEEDDSKESPVAVAKEPPPPVTAASHCCTKSALVKSPTTPGDSSHKCPNKTLPTSSSLKAPEKKRKESCSGSTPGATDQFEQVKIKVKASFGNKGSSKLSSHSPQSKEKGSEVSSAKKTGSAAKSSSNATAVLGSLSHNESTSESSAEKAPKMSCTAAASAGNDDKKLHTSSSGRKKLITAAESTIKKPATESTISKKPKSTADNTTNKPVVAITSSGKRPATESSSKKPDVAEKKPDKKPAADSTSKKPSADSTNKKPAVESVSKKPAVDSTSKKPAVEGVSKKPSVDSTSKKPAVEGVSKKPSADSTNKKPAVEGVSKKPSADSTNKKPAVEGASKKPSADSTNKKPTVESVSKKPTVESVSKKPSADSTSKKPTVEDASKKPTVESVSKKPTVESVSKKPSADSTSKKPTVEGATKKPTVESVSKKPSTDSTNKKPTVEGVSKKPTVDSTSKKPAVEGAVSKKPAVESVSKKPSTDSTNKKPTVEGVSKKPTVESVSKKPSADSTSKKPSADSTSKKPAVEGASKKPAVEGASKKQPNTSSAANKKLSNTTVDSRKKIASDSKISDSEKLVNNTSAGKVDSSSIKMDSSTDDSTGLIDLGSPKEGSTKLTDGEAVKSKRITSGRCTSETLIDMLITAHHQRLLIQTKKEQCPSASVSNDNSNNNTVSTAKKSSKVMRRSKKEDINPENNSFKHDCKSTSSNSKGSDIKPDDCSKRKSNVSDIQMIQSCDIASGSDLNDSITAASSTTPSACKRLDTDSKTPTINKPSNSNPETISIDTASNGSISASGVFSMYLNPDEATETVIKLLQKHYILGNINAMHVEVIKQKAINKVKMAVDKLVPYRKIIKLVDDYVTVYRTKLT